MAVFIERVKLPAVGREALGAVEDTAAALRFVRLLTSRATWYLWKQRYAEAVKTMTTVDVPPAEIHEIGLKEVARITAEMTKLAQSQGYKDLASLREA